MPSLLTLNYARLLRAQGASAAGTALDFATTILLVQALGWPPVPGAALGNVAGGATNFWLGRRYVFGGRGRAAWAQAGRYALVWLGSLTLNALGMYVGTKLLHANYLPVKIVVSAVVGVGFNYFMQLHFVFRQP